jgi:hypothetical protein
MRTWTLICGLVLGLTSADPVGIRCATAAPKRTTAADSKHAIAQIERHAERVFKLLDKDADGTIAGDELVNLTARVQREMKFLRSQRVIGGRVPIQPVAAAQAAIVDSSAINLPEFTAAFVAAAAQFDAEIRQQRVIHASTVVAQQAANDAAIYGSGNVILKGKDDKDDKHDKHGKDDDDNFREKRMDRERHRK